MVSPRTKEARCVPRLSSGARQISDATRGVTGVDFLPDRYSTGCIIPFRKLEPGLHSSRGYDWLPGYEVNEPNDRGVWAVQVWSYGRGGGRGIRGRVFCHGEPGLTWAGLVLRVGRVGYR